MVCLLAILLYTGQRLAQKHRLVITSTEPNRPNYHIYEANHEQPFPVPGRGSSIYRTLVTVDEPGTYVTVYCSIKATIDDLRGFVSGGLTSLPSRIDRRFDNDEKSENECLEYVNNLYFDSKRKAAKGGTRVIQVQDPNLLPVSHLIKTHQCTKRLLISLAYQRRVLCAHGHGFVTTYSDENLPTIKFDEPVEIADAIFDGQFVMQLSENGIRDVLVWNQGQLQSFTQRYPSGSWMERTYNGNEPHSGLHITELIKSSNAQVSKFMNEFATLEDTECGGSDCLWFQSKAFRKPKICRDRKFKHLQISVKKFDPIPAEGNIAHIRLTKPNDEDQGIIVRSIS
ncbi:BgTH12-05250 [Blumeria graminis f. sp. triticale]|uniref:BgtE-5745 n=4 Tax=Blumeria graminis TaxID=34373 RepID=A0A9X9MHD9_BLUGR|nr:putative secreted effector protein [Blumeria graminis f. sp. tritici 96224]CAD6502660.1 BgTH12-05250 [Blumeria graminis f. sp. triticale]VDB88091.1 BgtE-5745 [Blumeria graminis f. sp. tritici]